MRSRWKFRNVLAVIAAVGSLLLVGGVVLTREPKYEGRTAREWIYLLDPHVDHRAQHDMAAEAVVKIGGAAVPTIRDILREPRVTVLQKIKVLAQRYRFLPPDSIELADRQYRAARAAYMIAESGDVDISSLVPLLSFHLTNSNYAEVENGRALANAGPAGIAVLTNLLPHPDRRMRDRAIISLQHARSKPGVFEAYLRSVNDPDEGVRFIALSSLARYRTADPKLLVPIALERMKSTNYMDRWAATEIFQAFPEEPGSMPALSNLVSDPDPTVRSTAAGALGRGIAVLP